MNIIDSSPNRTVAIADDDIDLFGGSIITQYIEIIRYIFYQAFILKYTC